MTEKDDLRSDLYEKQLKLKAFIELQEFRDWPNYANLRAWSDLYKFMYESLEKMIEVDKKR
jgi:hypothetical protein